MTVSRILVSAAAAIAAASALTVDAHAEFKLRSPILDYGEIEFEHNGDVTFDKSKSGKNNNQSYTNEIELGLTPFWVVGIEAALGANAGSNIGYAATSFENYFQFTPQGKYWADLGFFAEIERPRDSASATAMTFGPLIQKEGPRLFGVDTLHTLNVLFEKEVGHNAGPETPVLVAWQTRFRVDPLFEPAVEYYGQVEDLANPGKPADQQHRIGPVLAGVYRVPYGKIKYEVGYLFGLTRATENGAAKWRMEFEVPF
jgi:hypothetical protein